MVPWNPLADAIESARRWAPWLLAGALLTIGVSAAAGSFVGHVVGTRYGATGCEGTSVPVPMPVAVATVPAAAADGSGEATAVVASQDRPVSRLAVDLELRHVRALRRRGALREASAALTLVRRAAPEDPRVDLEDARIHLEGGFSREAVRLAGRARAADPDSAEPLLVLAAAHEARDEVPRAAGAYAAYLERAPDGHYAGVARRYLVRHESDVAQAPRERAR